MFIKLLGAVIGVLMLATGLVTTGTSPATAAPSPGCVTRGEAGQFLRNRTQSIGYIEARFDTRGREVDRRGSTVWKKYQPCRGRANGAFVYVFYVSGRTLYWHYYLPVNGQKDMVSDSWGARA